MSDPYLEKILAKAAQGLTAEQIVAATLRSDNRLDLATFVIDLNWDEAVRAAWLSSLPLTPEFRDTAESEIRDSIESAVPEDLDAVFEKYQLDARALLTSLVPLARAIDVDTAVNLLLDHDRSTYEIWTALEDKPTLRARLDAVDRAAAKSREASELFLAICAEFSLQDLLSVLFVCDLTGEGVTLTSQILGIFPKTIHDYSPRMLVKNLPEPNVLLEAIPTILKDSSKETLAQILRSRERARTRWFQTVGPQVETGYTGVLSKPVPCLPGSFGVAKVPGVKKLQFPDFHLVFYEGGVVRAQQIGLDGLRSNEQEIHTIAHYYEGSFSGDQIALQECSLYPSSPKRPSLGDLIFKGLSIGETGQEATLRWRKKTARLKWTAGF